MNILTFTLYVIAFLVIGVPLIGFIINKFIEFGEFLYKKYEFIRTFFTQYYEHYAVGLMIVVIGTGIYLLAHYVFGVV